MTTSEAFIILGTVLTAVLVGVLTYAIVRRGFKRIKAEQSLYKWLSRPIHELEFFDLVALVMLLAVLT